MKRFLLLYNGAATPFGKLSPEEANSVKSAWGQWAQGLGEALFDEGAPIGNGAEVVKERDDNPDTLPIHGYSIIQAEDLERALALARSHPFLQNDAPAGYVGINVFEISPEPGSYVNPHPQPDYVTGSAGAQSAPVQAIGQAGATSSEDAYAPPAPIPAGQDAYEQPDYQTGPDGELDISHDEPQQPDQQYAPQGQPGQVVGPGPQNQPYGNPAPPQGPYQPQPNPGPLPPSQQGPPPPLPPQQRAGNPTANKPNDPLVM